MPDVFSNLVAQSLSSKVGIQPLIAPLFAPPPRLVSDATLLTSNDQPAVAAENAPSSITLAIFANETIDASEMEQPSEEVASPEKRTTLPDLVPPDVPQHAVSTLSLHHLLYPRHLAHDKMEPISSTSPPSVPATTIDETSSEDTSSLDPLPDAPMGASAKRSGARTNPSRPSPIYRPVPAQSQQATPPDAIPNAPEIPPAFTLHDDPKQTAKNLFHTVPTKHELQHAPPKDHPVGARLIAASTDLSAQPASPDSSPSLQPLAQSEHTMNRDDLPDQQSSSLAQPVGARLIAPPAITPESKHEQTTKPTQQAAAERQEGRRGRLIAPAASAELAERVSIPSSPIKPLLDQPALSKEPNPQESQAAVPSSAMQSIGARLIAPPVVVPAQNVLPPIMPQASQEMADTVANLKDTHSQEIPADRQRRGRLIAPTADLSAPHQPAAQDALHSPRVSPKQEAAVAKEEGEVPSIRITIGRIVVRATPAAQPTPIQKRVLRPAQSLGEYLKQRERGSR